MPLDRLQNARDVGGLRTEDGQAVRPGVLLRSDAPHPGDVPPDLPGWPPAHVVDLRTAGEPGTEAHPLLGPGTTVHELPMLGRANPLNMAAEDEIHHITLDDVYRNLLRTVDDLAAQVAGLVVRGDGAVLVHCSAGKDRTGVLTAALLRAVGVAREEIVADFVRSAPHAEAIVARMVAAARPEEREVLSHLLEVRHAHLMDAPAHVIEHVLDAFDAAPDGAAGRLQRAGGDVAALRAALLHPQN